MTDADRLDTITAQIREFRDARDWKQFHNAKDMATAISIEASELLEIFLWHNAEETESATVEKRDRIEEEMADIAIYLVEMADNLEIDLIEAMKRKLARNAAKYPVEKAKGSHAKYNEL
ncbi:MAG: nucleotide pyrophosphohydrolase [Verrucomicrobiales bacterium]|nr:nucleotide pyrophosphohydrolase [Verrucomicrobiales bacterium]